MWWEFLLTSTPTRMWGPSVHLLWGMFIQAIKSTARGHCLCGPASFRWASLDEVRGEAAKNDASGQDIILVR